MANLKEKALAGVVKTFQTLSFFATNPSNNSDQAYQTLLSGAGAIRKRIAAEHIVRNADANFATDPQRSVAFLREALWSLSGDTFALARTKVAAQVDKAGPQNPEWALSLTVRDIWTAARAEGPKYTADAFKYAASVEEINPVRALAAYTTLTLAAHGRDSKVAAYTKAMDIVDRVAVYDRQAAFNCLCTTSLFADDGNRQRANEKLARITDYQTGRWPTDHIVATTAAPRPVVGLDHPFVHAGL